MGEIEVIQIQVGKLRFEKENIKYIQRLLE